MKDNEFLIEFRYGNERNRKLLPSEIIEKNKIEQQHLMDIMKYIKPQTVLLNEENKDYLKGWRNEKI